MKKAVYSILASFATVLVLMSIFVSCENTAKNCDKPECDTVCCPAQDANADCAKTCDKPCCAKEMHHKEGAKKCCKAGKAKECKHLEGEMKKCCAGKDSIACAEHKAAMEMHGKMCAKDSTKACCMKMMMDGKTCPKDSTKVCSMKMKAKMCAKDSTKACCMKMKKEIEEEVIEE